MCFFFSHNKKLNQKKTTLNNMFTSAARLGSKRILSSTSRLTTQRRLYHLSSSVSLNSATATSATTSLGKQPVDGASASASAGVGSPITQSFCKGLFTGELLDYKLFPFPSVLTKDEKETLDSLIEPVDK